MLQFSDMDRYGYCSQKLRVLKLHYQLSLSRFVLCKCHRYFIIMLKRWKGFLRNHSSSIYRCPVGVL